MPVPPRLRDAAVVAGLLILCGAPLARLDPSRAAAGFSPEVVVRAAFAAGQLPLWNPYFAGGQPLLADPALAVFYPPLVLTRFAPFEWARGLLAAIHASLFTIGVYLLVRRLGETRMVAALAAVAGVFAVAPLSGPWPRLPAVSWLPLLIAVAPGIGRGPRRVPMWPLVFVLAAVFLGGSLRGALYAVAALGASAAFVGLWPLRDGWSRRALVVQGGVAITAAAALTAFQTFPQIGLSSHLAAGELVEPRLGSALVFVEHDAPWRPLLPALRGHVAVSTCERVRPSELVAAGTAVLDGWRPYPSNYPRFTTLAAGAYPVPDQPAVSLPGANDSAARPDLMSWLGVENLVACQPPDPARWTLLQQAGDVATYRAVTPAVAPAWTCAPRAVTRDELEHALATHRYNGIEQAGPRYVVHVRWSERAGDAERLAAEKALGLVPLQEMAQRTWQYELADSSVSNVQAIVLHPLVEDTAHINRHTFEPESLPAVSADQTSKSEWLVGATPCPGTRAARVIRTNRHRGRTVVQVSAPQDDGVVVLPRLFFPGLKAWVDGKRAPLLRVNLTFVAVPVSAGVHRVDVSYVPDSQVYGAAVTAFALLASAGVWWRSRRRR